MGTKAFLRKKLMGSGPFRDLTDRFDRIQIQGRVEMCLARAAATAAARAIDPLDPETWEFSGFSQHGEDGIIDYLCSKMESRNLFFVEIGAADGLENCTAWLAIAKSYGGLMVEGDTQLATQCRESFQLLKLNWALHFANLFVDDKNVEGLLKMCPYRSPDVFSLDIDSIDYYVFRKVFELGFKPKLVIVEYNSAFGPDQAVTIPYKSCFARWQEHSSGLYYGVSIAGWRRLFETHGYQFVTTDKSGANAFFVDPSAFPDGFTRSLKQVSFRENIGDTNGGTRPYVDSAGDRVLPLRDWRTQYEMIKDMKLFKITDGEHVRV